MTPPDLKKPVSSYAKWYLILGSRMGAKMIYQRIKEDNQFLNKCHYLKACSHYRIEELNKYKEQLDSLGNEEWPFIIESAKQLFSYLKTNMELYSAQLKST